MMAMGLVLVLSGIIKGRKKEDDKG
jgi:hypothetical protein